MFFCQWSASIQQVAPTELLWCLDALFYKQIAPLGLHSSNSGSLWLSAYTQNNYNHAISFGFFRGLFVFIRRDTGTVSLRQLSAG
mgnify:CR=1 FL=1